MKKTALHFINISKIFLIIMGIIYSSIIFSNPNTKFPLPDKLGFFFWKCHQSICNVFLKKKGIPRTLIAKDVPYPKIQLLNKSTVELFFSCGSPCNYTMFYNSQKGISKSF